MPCIGKPLAFFSPCLLLPTPYSLLPAVLLSAHLDTVFPANTPVEPIEARDSPRIYAPGICDNAAGLTALLAIAAALRYANITPPIPILFAANVGEEGEGDLRGMRHLFERGPYRTRIAAAIALEGGGSSAVVTRALGSLRFRVTITGPGGHSWTDAGAPNPILLLSHALTQIAALVQTRIETLTQFGDLTHFFFADDILPTQEIFLPKKRTLEETLAFATDQLALLEVTDWTHETLEPALKKLGEEKSWSVKENFMLLRAILTGSTMSPPLLESMVVFGKARTLDRLRRFLDTQKKLTSQKR